MHFTRNFSAVIIISKLISVLPNVTKFSITSVSAIFKDAVLLQIFLVVSHPVSACNVGRTSVTVASISFATACNGTTLVVSPFYCIRGGNDNFLVVSSNCVINVKHYAIVSFFMFTAWFWYVWYPLSTFTHPNLFPLSDPPRQIGFSPE